MWKIEKCYKIIFEAILRTFAGIDYESVEPSIKE